MQRLVQLIKTYTFKRKSGLTELAAQAGCSVGTIYNVRSGAIPRPDTAYRLARACGASEREAEQIAAACAQPPKASEKEAV